MKKFIALMTALLLTAALLTGCGAPAPQDSNKLMIGGIGPLTGDGAHYGISVRNGAQLAVDEINAAGGIAGFEAVLDFQDSVGDPESAVSAYGKLIDNGMKISLGGTYSGETASVVAAAKEDGILVLAPTATADASIAGNDCAFRVCFTDSSQGLASADYIANNNMADKVAVLYQSDIDYSVGLFNNFQTRCAELGVEIVEVQTYTTDTRTDFTTQINAIKDSGVKLVFIPIYAAEASTFLTQAQGKLSDILYFGCDGLDGILSKVSDPSQAENVMMLTPYVADSPEENVQKFVSAYKAAYEAVPDQFAADAYDAVYTMKAAVEKAGITDLNDPEFNAKLVAAMTQITVDGVTGTMTWNADGETVKEAQAMLIHDGVATLYAAD